MEAILHITEEIIDTFAEFSGDKNPIHVDEKFASRTPFKKRIAHGTIILAKISKLLTDKMGQGNILLSEEIKFLKPTYIGDILKIKVIEITPLENSVKKLDIVTLNQKGEKVLDCIATCRKVPVLNERK